MTKKKRSEIFAEKKARQEESPYQSKQKRQERRKRRKKRKKQGKAFKLLIILALIISPIFLYQKLYNTPQRSINKGILAVKELDYEGQRKYFDKMDKVIKVLGESYSSSQTEQEEFLKANFSSLKVRVKDKEKTKNGLKVEVDVTNQCYIDIYDKLDPDNKKIHEKFVRELSNEDQDKTTISASLILDKKFTHYKIYESREFIDGTLGGALKYAQETSWSDEWDPARRRVRPSPSGFLRFSPYENPIILSYFVPPHLVFWEDI